MSYNVTSVTHFFASLVLWFKWVYLLNKGQMTGDFHETSF